MKKAFKIFVSAALAIVIGVMPVMAAEETGLDLNLDGLDLMDQIVVIQEKLDELAGKIQDTEKKLADKNEEITLAQQDLEEAEEKEHIQYEAMKKRIRYMYENGDTTLFDAIVNSENMADVLNKVEYAAEISNYDRQMILAYIETENEISALKATLETERSELETLIADFTAQEQQLMAIIDSKQDEYQDTLAAMVVAAFTQDPEFKSAITAAVASGDYTQLENIKNSAKYDSSVWNIIVQAAYSQIGTWYEWGGSTPNVGLDCSGLVQYCYAQAGINIAHQSGVIAANGTQTNNPKPGDICWWEGHVGIYIGNGQYIDAQQTGTQVQVRNLSDRSVQPVFYKYGDYTESTYTESSGSSGGSGGGQQEADVPEPGSGSESYEQDIPE